MPEGPIDLGLDGIQLPGQSDEAKKLTGAAPRTGPVDLQLDSVNFKQRTDHFVVTVNGQPMSAPLATRLLAEQFISNLPENQRASAQIVQSDASGNQLLLG